MRGTWTTGPRAVSSDEPRARSRDIECEVETTAENLVLVFDDPPPLEVDQVGHLTSEAHTGDVRVDEVQDLDQDRRRRLRAVVSVIHSE